MWSSGFDQQIAGSKALADAAIKRLPGINATILQAVADNAETKAMLEDVTENFSNAQETIAQLENTVDGLEVETVNTFSLA